MSGDKVNDHHPNIQAILGRQLPLFLYGVFQFNGPIRNTPAYINCIPYRNGSDQAILKTRPLLMQCAFSLISTNARESDSPSPEKTRFSARLQKDFLSCLSIQFFWPKRPPAQVLNLSKRDRQTSRFLPPLRCTRRNPHFDKRACPQTGFTIQPSLHSEDNSCHHKTHHVFGNYSSGRDVPPCLVAKCVLHKPVCKLLLQPPSGLASTNKAMPSPENHTGCLPTHF